MNVRYHQSRVNESIRALYGHGPGPELARLIKIPPEYIRGRVKCRFLYDQAGDPLSWNCEFASYAARDIKTFRLVSGNPDYSLKYTDRSSLDRLQADRGSCDDIIIVKNRLITDAGSANIVFLKDGSWFTPLDPLLKGTARAVLLETGRIAVIDISEDDLSRYDGFRLINAMLPFDEQPVFPMSAIKK